MRYVRTKIRGWSAIAIGGAIVSAMSPAFCAPVVADDRLPPLPESQQFDFFEGLKAYSALAENLPEEELTEVGLLSAPSTNPETLFAFVRDEIATLPYPGTLRAPDAVISARSGNAQDKAELLASLLEQAGYDARVASAPAKEGASRPSTCSAETPADDAALELVGLNGEVRDRFSARARRDLAALKQVLGELEGDEALIEPALGRQYWVQYRSAEGWVDMDPSRPAAAMGDPAPVPDRLTRGGEDPHTVYFQVTVEKLSGRRLVERSHLDYEVSARDGAYLDIQLTFAPEKASVGGTLNDKFASVIGKSRSVLPVLYVDSEPQKGRAFPLVTEAGAFGKDEGGDPVTAVYIDIEARVPGGEVRRARRVVADFVPAEVRAQGVPSAADIVPVRYGDDVLPPSLTNLWTFAISSGGLSAFDIVYDSYLTAARMPSLYAEAEEGSLAPNAVLWLAALRVYQEAAASEALLRQQLASASGLCAGVGAPRVFSHRIRPYSEDSLEIVGDWMLDHVDVFGRGDDMAKQAAEFRLSYGIRQSALETTLAELGFSSEDSETLLTTSTGLAGRDIEQVSSSVLAVSAASDARADLEAGYRLIGNANAPMVWWRVNAETGATDARLAGAGNAFRKISKRPGARRTGGIYHLDSSYADIELSDVADDIIEEALEAQKKGQRKQKKLARKQRSRSKMSKRGVANEYLTTLDIGVYFTIISAGIYGVYQGSMWIYALFGG